MIGFRSKTPWKMIVAITYYGLCFLGFNNGVFKGVALLIVLWTAPVLAYSARDAIASKRWELLYSVPVWIAVVAVSIILFGTNTAESENPAKETIKIAATDAPVAADEPNVISVAPLADATKVFITRSGGKYHAEGCRFVKDKDSIAITISQAQADGKEPCSVCLK